MLRIAQYRTWSELAELRPQWNALLSGSASDTVFLTWQWCEAWWKNYSAGREIFVLAAWEGKDVVGVAPLYREKVRLYGRSWRRLRLIGDGSHDSDYLDCFAKRTREAETMAAVAGFLGTHHELWDWLEFNGPQENSPCMAALGQFVRERHWTCKTEKIRCATLHLPETWDQYLRILEPRFRTKVRSSLALLHEHLKSTPERCGSEKEIGDWLPVLFDLHTRRWASDNEPGVFRDPVKRAFYLDLSRAALEQGWLAFHRLDWGERPLALQYGLIYGNSFHLLQEGYDPAFSAVRPGVALRAWLMRYWIEGGLREYDFLAGVAPYKLDWGAKEKSSIRLLISARRASTLVAVDAPNVRTQARERLARVTPEAVLSARRRVVSARKQKAAYPAADSNDSVPQAASARPARRLASVVYSSGLLGKITRSVAGNYAWSGVSQRWPFPQRRTRPAVHIFQYHRVNDGSDSFLGGLAVNAFRSQMEYLAKSFPILTLDQVANEQLSDQHKYYVAITFDDGYRDNFISAYPILKQLGIPATIFLATGYVDSGQLPWYDQVRLAFKLTMRSQFSLADLGGPSGKLGDSSSRLHTMEQTLNWLRCMLESERQSALDEIYRALGVPADLSLPNQMLRWEDIRQMSKHNISFGAHTVSHPVLSKIPASELEREIHGSKRAIENRLQSPVSHFAYPFGQSADFNMQAKQSVQDAGFKTAVTTIWGLNEPGDDPFELKRFTPWETDPAEFKMKLDWFRFHEAQKGDERKQATTAMHPAAQEARI